MNGAALAHPADMADIQELLMAASLPVTDLADCHVEFLCLRDAVGIAGVIGLQRFGDAALLRSFVVREDLRGGGLGVALVQELEQHAASVSVRQIYLLTETAGQFFERSGYVVVERNTVTEAVRGSSEFRALCPASATCMFKQLG